MNHKEILQHLQSPGYYVIPNYLSKEECQSLVKHLDKIFTENDDKVQRDFKEGMGGDKRLFGLENTHPTIWNYIFENPYLNIFKKHTENIDLCPETVLAGIVERVDGEVINSGGGWHRDPGSQYGKKIKTILYLSDVTSENGPLTIVPDSRITDVGQGKYRKNVEGCHRGLRICDEFIKELITQGKEPVELVAEAGTMILVDVSNIHMGKPIGKGERYSLTNYFQHSQKSATAHLRTIRKHYIENNSKYETLTYRPPRVDF